MSLDLALRCKHCGSETWERNITYNLVAMANAAGVYEAMYNPPDDSVASDFIEILKGGLKALRENPKKFKEHNPSNGWGSYESLVKFVEAYLEAALENPSAEVNAT